MGGNRGRGVEGNKGNIDQDEGGRKLELMDEVEVG